MKRISATILLSLGLLFAALVGGAGMAGAQPVHNTSSDCYGGTCPTPTVVTTPSQPVTTDPVYTTATSAPLRLALAFTGTDAVASGVVGLALIGGGVVLVGATRRRRHAS